jgi:hypothetical protein
MGSTGPGEAKGDVWNGEVLANVGLERTIITTKGNVGEHVEGGRANGDVPTNWEMQIQKDSWDSGKAEKEETTGS